MEIKKLSVVMPVYNEVDTVEANSCFDREFALRRIPTVVRELARTREVNRRIAAVLLQERNQKGERAVIAEAR